MKKQVLASLLRISNTLDYAGLYKEATEITKVMQKLAQTEKSPEVREAYYKQVVDDLKSKLLSGKASPKDLIATIDATGENSIQDYKNQGFLNDAQVEALKKQIKRIVREFGYSDNQDGKKEIDSSLVDAEKMAHGLLASFMKNNKISLEDFSEDKFRTKAKKYLGDYIKKKNPENSEPVIKIMNNLIDSYDENYVAKLSAPTSTTSTPAATKGSAPSGLGEVRFQDRNKSSNPKSRSTTPYESFE